jgi:TRAP-type C4-dicarboxylate transport system permease small subunit
VEESWRKWVLIAQGLGAVFFAVFFASYTLALPSNRVLHGELIFKIPISIFGGLFLLFSVLLLVYSFAKRRGKKENF